MTDYRTIAPVIIDNVMVTDDVNTTSLSFFFGSSEPADLYWNGELVASTSIPIDVGVAGAPLPNPHFPHSFVPDDTIVIPVNMIYGAPATCTDTEFLQGQNVAYIGSGNAWEMIYYRDVTDAGAIATLKHILRCQRSTWLAGYKHNIKDTVVFGNSGLVRFDRPISELYTTASTLIVPAGASKATATGLGGSFYVQGGSVRPWPPINASGVRSGADVDLTWTRVDRAPSTMHDGDDVTPLTDAPEAYTLQIYKFPYIAGNQPLRQVTLSSPAFTYTSAMQTTDGTTTDTALILLITQDSALVGHGFPYQGVVNVHD